MGSLATVLAQRAFPVGRFCGLITQHGATRSSPPSLALARCGSQIEAEIGFHLRIRRAPSGGPSLIRPLLSDTHSLRPPLTSLFESYLSSRKSLADDIMNFCSLCQRCLDPLSSSSVRESSLHFQFAWLPSRQTKRSAPSRKLSTKRTYWIFLFK